MLVFEGEDALPVPERALMLGAEPHPALRRWPELCGWQPLKPTAHAWETAGFQRIEDPAGSTWPLVLFLPGKSKDETLAGFAKARELLEPGGRLVVAMPNTAGAGRFEKELAKAAGTVTSLQKHKCRAFHTRFDQPDDSLLATWRELGRRRNVGSFTVEAGIFSSDHIDPGSQLLAEHLPAHLHGHVADLGAGWGFLTDALIKRCPKVRRIDLFEADARALACAQANLAGAACELNFHWHDVTTGLPETYDAVIMNPPFHSGQATDIDLGRAFLQVAIDSLRRGGRMWLVANRQLPYEPVLESHGLAWRKMAEDRVYKILSAEKR